MSTPDTGFVPVSTIPRWPGFVRPLLEVLSDGKTWRKRDMERAITDLVGLTDDQLARDSRVGTAARPQPDRVGDVGAAPREGDRGSGTGAVPHHRRRS